MRDWERFFDEHAPHYEENVFTQNTRAEVEFLLSLFSLESGAAILDLGCGTGRHAIRLAAAGFAVTGVDLSAGMLEQAAKNAAEQGVPVVDGLPEPGQLRLVKAAAEAYEPDQSYDLAICLCEGGVGLAERDADPIAHDLGIFRTAFKALKPGGSFLLTAMNGYAVIRQMTDELVQQGRFDPATMLSVYEDEWNLPEGKKSVFIRERLLIPPEMVAMLRHAGFEILHVWGGTAGEWGRRPVKLDEVEAMYVCRKP